MHYHYAGSLWLCVGSCIQGEGWCCVSYCHKVGWTRKGWRSTQRVSGQHVLVCSSDITLPVITVLLILCRHWWLVANCYISFIGFGPNLSWLFLADVICADFYFPLICDIAFNNTCFTACWPVNTVFSLASYLLYCVLLYRIATFDWIVRLTIQPNTNRIRIVQMILFTLS